MNIIAYVAYILIAVAFTLFLASGIVYFAAFRDKTIQKSKALHTLIGSIVLLVIVLIGSGITIYYAVTPMYHEIPKIEGHYAFDVPPVEIVPLENDYCLAIYSVRSEAPFEMGLFHSKTENEKTLYRYEDYLPLNLPWFQSDDFGWWMYDFEEFRYYHEWVEMGTGFYGAVCPKEGKIVPDESHSATIIREITVNDEVFIVYIAIERAF